MSTTSFYEVYGQLPTLPKETIDKLLEIAEGGGGSSGGGVLVVHLGGGGVLDKTWGEIDAADVAVVVFSGRKGGEKWHSREFVTSTNILDGNYFVSAVHDGGTSDYVALSPDEYPARQTH